MRAPIRSESEAVRLTFAFALTVAVSIAVGVLWTPVAGVAVFALIALVAITAYLRAAPRDRRPSLRIAASEPHPHGAPARTRHVLVVANEELSGRELRDRILRDRRGAVEIDVLSPILVSHVHQGVSDIDRERRRAERRLRRSLEWAASQGIPARGRIGDSDPTVALEDELRDFGADEVLVVTHPREHETWQERKELERLREELEIPVGHVVAPAASTVA